jgi:methylated-DNA-[protein]-cysteine S-methyltransferase
MAPEYFYTIFQTTAGWVGVLSSDGGLRRIILPQASEADVLQLLGNSLEPATLSKDQDLSERFKTYFSGRRVDFPDKLDFSGATPFQREVWRVTRLIPYGQTRSYRWVAAQIGQPGAARAVGQALGKNPLPIIVPCHRVLAHDGGLGGFTGGIEMKKLLLSLETSSARF